MFDDDRVRRNLFTAEGWRLYHVTKAALQRSSREALALVLEATAVGPRLTDLTPSIRQ